MPDNPGDFLSAAVDRATDALRRHQKPDGHFVFELEAVTRQR